MKVHIRKHLLIAFGLCVILFAASTSWTQNKREVLSRRSLPLGGRGADHVMVVVRDIDATSKVFSNTLGFNVSQRSKFPEGVENSVMHFKNRSFLELLGVYDREKAKETPEVKFLEKHEGGTGFGVHVASAESALSFLRARGIESSGPKPYPSVVPGNPAGMWIWRTVEFKKPTVPGGNVFLIEYNEPLIEEYRRKDPQIFEASKVHPNTAEKLQAVWVAVKDLKAAVRAYESIGFTAKRRISLPQLGAKGREIEAGEGLVLLLEASSVKGEVASFLTRRGEGVIGVSIKVTELNTALNILETNLKQKLRPYEGAYGKSVLVPVEVTRGIWVEMFK